MPSIWVDADACPVVIRDILLRAAHRTGLQTTLVSHQPLRIPPSPHVQCLQVVAGLDAADNEIIQRAAAGDLVVTQDIPLAAEVLAKGAHALNPRGERYTPDTIRSRLTLRDFMETMRASGIQSGGPPPLNQQDRKAFADALDRLLVEMRGHGQNAQGNNRQ
jgi:uncharacterized protein YaiI (UPF0178 family)